MTRTKNQDHRKRNPAANTVHHGRAGKIDKAATGQPAFTGTEAATPGPVAEERIDQTGGDGCDQQIGGKTHTLCCGARDNGRGSSTEHRLKQEECRLPGIIEGEHHEATTK